MVEADVGGGSGGKSGGKPLIYTPVKETRSTNRWLVFTNAI
jgi:hypothetical protein